MYGTMHELWETSTETIDQPEDSVAVLAVAADAADLEAADLLLAEAGVTIEETEKCLTLPAAIVEKLARFLSDPQTVNRFTAAIVLRKWAEEATGHQTTDQDLTIEPPVLLRHKADLIWVQLMPN
jgi:hypothetical protein